jgi:hypothetical protein
VNGVHVLVCEESWGHTQGFPTELFQVTLVISLWHDTSKK